MAHAPLKLDWAALLSNPAAAVLPDADLIVLPDSSASAPAPASVPASASAGCDAGSMDSSSSGDGFPLTEITDRSLEERIQRLSQTLASDLPARLPDRGDKLRANLLQLQDEAARRDQARTPKPPKAAGDAQSRPAESPVLLEDSHTPLSASQSSFPVHLPDKLDDKADDAFSDELRIFSGDKHNGSRENGSKMFKDVEMLSQPTTKVSRELPSRCFANKNEQRFRGNSFRNNYSSCISKRKLRNHVDKRRTYSETRGPQNWEFQKVGFPLKVRDVVLLDDEDVQPSELIQADMPDECGNTTSFRRKESKIYYPSRDDPDSVEISFSDIKCLEPETYLSSTIMNFYIQYLQRSVSSTKRTRGEYLLFNTYFYKKLMEAMSSKGDRASCFLKLRRWWKGASIFEKAYILLPIHGDVHWSLVIICIPAKEDESGPVILHLDSLGLHCSNQIFDTIQSYLKEEWSYMKQNAPSSIPISEKTWNNLPTRIEKKKIMVPQQKNEYDCGLFVLYFIERFIREAPDRLSKKDLDRRIKKDLNEPTMFGRKWFKPEEASGLRNQIQQLIIEEFESNMETEPPTSPTNTESVKECERVTSVILQI